MKTLFIVPSAINTKYGVYSTEERFEQTKRTIQSVYDKVPTAEVLLVNCSVGFAITPAQQKELKCTSLADLSSDTNLAHIYNEPKTNHDIVKNLSELYAFKTVLTKMQSPLPAYDRIFKLSGRYYLTDEFNLANFSDPTQYYFAQACQSQFPPMLTGNLAKQYMTRLWSFPKNSLKLVLSRYNIMIEDFLASINHGKYRDIEHLMYKYFESVNTTELPKIGVSGKLGPTGVEVND